MARIPIASIAAAVLRANHALGDLGTPTPTPAPSWILATGAWNDAAPWADDQLWKDS